jgi:hypothetical protein
LEQTTPRWKPHLYLGVLLWRMRIAFQLLLLLAVGCTPVSPGTSGAAIWAAAGKDCAGMRQGQPPCRPSVPPPRFCTRSLGVVDCWANPDALNGPPPHQVADGPLTLTPAQLANSSHGWP